MKQLPLTEVGMLRAATLKDAVDTFALHLRDWLDGNQLWLEADRENVWLCNGLRQQSFSKYARPNRWASV